MTKLISQLAVVFGAQALLAWFFYRCRAISHAPWASSDLVVFGLPLLVGFAIAAIALFLGFHRQRVAITLGLSAAGAVVASLIGTAVAFNLYGT